jgi:serine protease
VLALRHAGTKVGFSDLGPEVTLSAPGGNCVDTADGAACLYPILAATNSGLTSADPSGYGYTDSFNYSLGTSFSSPLVAGVAALMLSQQPALTPAQLTGLLKSTARAFPTDGGDNGPGQPAVTQCHAPVLGVAQYQCYCTTALCGAGMVDAGRAVAAAAATPAPVADSGGGGAASLAWVLGVLLATAVLKARPR